MIINVLLSLCYVTAPMRSPYVIEALPAELLLTEGVPHLLNCPMSGWPLPHISWYQTGMLVSDTDRKHSLQNGSLYFDPALREDSGRYYCIGSNVLGSVPSTSVNISVACGYWLFCYGEFELCFIMKYHVLSVFSNCFNLSAGAFLNIGFRNAYFWIYAHTHTHTHTCTNP